MEETKENNEEKKWTVYVHISPSNKYYVGETSQKPERRWRNGKGYEHNVYFWRAIQKYGWNNFQHEIIANNLTEEEADKMERTLIAKLNSSDYHYGYNITDGGDARSGLKEEKHPLYGKHLSPEVVAKMKEARKNYVPTEETKLKTSNSMKKVWKNEEFKQKYSEMMKNRWQDDTYRESMSRENAPCYGRTGKQHPMYGIHGKDHPSSKPVICLNTLEIFESGADADYAYGFKKGRVQSCCNEENHSCGKDQDGNKLIWMRFDDYLNLTSEEINERLKKSKNIQTKKVVKLETEEIFNSIADAARQCNGDRKAIRACCAGGSKTSNGFHWMYYDEYINLSQEEIQNVIQSSAVIIVPPKKKVINLDTLQVYNTAMEACRDCGGKNAKTIRNCCKGLSEVSYGYHWMYYDEYLDKNEEIL